MDPLLTERQQRPPAHPKRGARLCRAPGVLLDLGEKSQYPLKSLRGVLGGSPLRPFLSASHLVVPDLSLSSVVLGPVSPSPAPPLCSTLSFSLSLSSALLASYVPCCLWGRGLAEDFGYHFAQGVVLRGSRAPPVLTSEGSEVILGGMQPVSSRGPSHSGQHQSPCPGLRLEAVSHCGPLTELG